MPNLQDLQTIAAIVGSLGTGTLALIAIAAAIPKIQDGLIRRIGRAFTKDTNLAIASLEQTVVQNHAEGLERFTANETAIADAKIQVQAVETAVDGVAETLDAVAILGQHNRRAINGHIRSGRHLPKRGTA